jgi:hypothetical protein
LTAKIRAACNIEFVTTSTSYASPEAKLKEVDAEAAHGPDAKPHSRQQSRFLEIKSHSARNQATIQTDI